MLPGRSPDGDALCRRCAGITTRLTCDRCKAEAERFRKGLCARCALDDDLRAVLRPGNDLRLHRLVDVLTSAERPESIYTWMRGAKAGELLTRLGKRELDLTHEAFDQMHSSTAAEHLRAILEHHRVLPQRGPTPLVRFETWLAERIAQLPDDGTRATIERFGTWHHLRRTRRRAEDPAARLQTATHAAKQEITEAGKFLLWLRDTHDTGPAGLRQAHIDAYLSSGTSTRRHIRNFVRWLNSEQQRRGADHLDAPRRSAQSEPQLTQTQRIQLVVNCITLDQVILSTRIAGLLLLLWAHPLNKIVALTTNDLTLDPDGIRIRLGKTPTLVPEAIAPMFWTYLSARANQRTTNTGTDWLFPGSRAGHHLHESTLSERLLVLGIDGQRARNATLRDLGRELDAKSLVNTLGYAPAIIAAHIERAGGTGSDYVTLRRRDLGDKAR